MPYKPTDDPAEIERRKEIARQRKRRFRASDSDAARGYHDREQARQHQKHRREKPSIFDAKVLVLDGESGPEKADGRRYYHLMQVYDGDRIHTLRNERGISLTQFCYWLYREIIKPDRMRASAEGEQLRHMATGFAIGFDVDQMIGYDKHISDELAYEICRQKSPRASAVRGPGWSEDVIIPESALAICWSKKTLRVRFLRRKNGQLVQREDGSYASYYTLKIDDVFSLTAKSFEWTVDSIVKPHFQDAYPGQYDELMAVIHEGKQRRKEPDWGGWSFEDEQRYNEAELILTHAYIKHLVHCCQTIDLTPASLAGPAPLARALLYKNGLMSHIKPEHYDTVEYQEHDPHFKRVKRAFYGGRIELAGQGQLDEFYEYDLSSAYPYGMTRLPCGAHGAWRDFSDAELRAFERERKVPDFALFRISYANQGVENRNWGPLPYRNGDKTIIFPTQGDTYVYSPETQMMFDHWQGEIVLEEGQVWESDCDHEHPFEAMIIEGFAERARLKREGDGAELVLKLSLNSLYGILAQTAGSYRKTDDTGKTIGYHTPKTSNLFLAGYITSLCRSRVSGAALQYPDLVFNIATDAVYSLAPLPLPVPEKKTLGTWEMGETHCKTIFIAPGVYCREDGKAKTRGFSVPLPYETIRDIWEDGQQSAYETTDRRYKDLRAAIKKHGETYVRDADWGLFPTQERKIVLTPNAIHTKRQPGEFAHFIDTLAFTRYPPKEPHWEGGTIQPSKSYVRPFDPPDLANEAFWAVAEWREGSKVHWEMNE